MSIYADNTGIMKPPAGPQRQGRRMGQVANPYQQQPGDDRNVEQQALGQALAAPPQAPQAQPQPAGGQIALPAGIGGGAAVYPQSFAPGEGNPNAGPPPRLDQPQAPITPVAGRPFLLGFETSKLLDPNKGPGESGKYTSDAKAFGQAYLSGVPISRGNLGPMVEAMRARGLSQALAVGDDKIDPDGPGPQSAIDVVGSDGSIRYQNTTDNAQYEARYRAGLVGHGAPHSAPPGGLAGGGYDHSGINPGGARPPMAAGTPIGAGDWASLGITPAQATPGMAIPGMPGKVIQHQNGGWVIADAGGAAASGTSLPPGAPGGGGQPDPSVYHPGTLPTTDLPTYDPYKFDMFNAPDQSGIDDPTQALLKRILGSTSMSDQNVAQLKEKNKEEALAMQKQLQDQATARAAGRGVAGGGNLDAINRRIGDAALAQVLAGNRETDLRKMVQDRADQAQALGLSNEYLNSQMNRATQGYGARLAGENAQAGEQFKGYGSRADSTRFALERALQQERLNQEGADSIFNREMGRGDLANRNRALDIQRELGIGGLDVDRSRISSSDRQFDLSNALARQELAERMRQFNNQLGYNYNALSANSQNDMIDRILRGGGF